MKPSAVRSTTKTKIDWTHGTRPWQTVSLKGKTRYLSPLLWQGELHSKGRGLLNINGLVYSGAMALPSLKTRCRTLPC